MQDTIGNPLERQDTAGNCYQCSAWRKRTVLFVASWMTLAATFSSTSLLSVADEIASEFSTSPVSVNVSSGALLLAMGLSSFVWGPISIVSDGSIKSITRLTMPGHWKKSCLYRLRKRPDAFHYRSGSRAYHACLCASAHPFWASGNIFPRGWSGDPCKILLSCK